MPTEPIEVEVTDLAHDGRGVGRCEGKAVFVHGALPGERVRAKVIDRARKYDEALTEEVLVASDDRVTPGCDWFNRCGGCALQHLDSAAQRDWKHKRLVDNLERLGEVQPERWLTPIAGDNWFYRRRARLSARWVKGKDRVLVGFREPQGRFVADVGHCRVLHQRFSHELSSFSDLLGTLSVSAAVPQIEIAAGDDSGAMILRHMEPLTSDDIMALKRWSEEKGIAVYLQSKGPDTVMRLTPDEHVLSYRLDTYDLEMEFGPQQFIQVNAGINARLIETAIELLDLNGEERVLDLFCGLGNFSLPLARHAAHVTGIEGLDDLVESARANANRNQIEDCEFDVADLTEDVSQRDWYRAGFDAVLLDPPRSGAFEILPLVAGCGAKRVVYVSCNPATLARDAGELVRQHGFTLKAAGIADMFPHTAHVESIALFERPDSGATP
ncbi:MAG: 23S rRNA (uracil(1939)-C(5))-methyltransferase RlmD [Pseudomonadota bacterium]